MATSRRPGRRSKAGARHAYGPLPFIVILDSTVALCGRPEYDTTPGAWNGPDVVQRLQLLDVKYRKAKPPTHRQLGAGGCYLISNSFVPADLLSRNTSTLYLPFGSPPGFEMWNSVQASPVGAIDWLDSSTT